MGVNENGKSGLTLADAEEKCPNSSSQRPSQKQISSLCSYLGSNSEGG